MAMSWNGVRGYLVSCAASLLVACASCTGVSVTGNLDQGDTHYFSQSETAATRSQLNDQTVLTVFYNDMTDPGGTITLGMNQRIVSAGASLFGWSYSEDKGATWIYGERISPPPGWGILWGDPSATTSLTQPGVVFAAQEAAPNSKMPASGKISGSLEGVLGGACIARSVDAGRTFSIYRCVTNTTPTNDPASTLGHFYDGSSMAASSDGAIYAAFTDVHESTYDVWRASDENSGFVRIDNPFPGNDMGGHPRLRAHPSDGSLYIAGRSNTGALWINRYSAGAWGTQRLVTPTSPAAGAPLAQPQCLAFQVSGLCTASQLALRAGNQFSFDVGHPDDPMGRDAIRFLYTTFDAQTKHLVLISATCDANLSSCYQWGGPSDWGVAPSAEEQTAYFNPLVRAWPGSPNSDPVWMSSFSRRDGFPTTTLHVLSARLEYQPGTSTRVFNPIVESDAMLICPDLRGYWGDYDDLVAADIVIKRGIQPHLVIFGVKTQEPRWLRTMSDSQPSCFQRWQFSQYPLHVRALLFR